MRHPIYTRTQTLWLVWALLPPTMAGTATAMLAKVGATVAVGLPLLLATGVTLLLLLSRFTVEVGEGRVEWRFGHIGWPRWQVALDEIASVEVTTSTAWESWGIRKTRTGMLYNASGTRALRLNLRDGRTLRLGSDEPERLAGFITARLPAAPAARRAEPARRG